MKNIMTNFGNVMFFIVVFWLLTSSFSNLWALDSDYRAWIESEPVESGLSITAYCESDEGGDIVYKLITSKTGASGTTKSSQKGCAFLRSGELQSLACLRLGITADDYYEIYLEVYKKDGELVAQDTIGR